MARFYICAPLGLVICLLLGTSLLADHPPESLPLPGHSTMGDTFDEGPRRGATFMDGTGDVSFPISTASPEAQRFFNQGIGQLYGFWYLEAERSFRQVAAIDPECPMAYWGMAMANITNAKRAKNFIAEAVKRVPDAKLSPNESEWINALSAYHKDEPKKDGLRKKNFLAALQKMMDADPEDINAKAFWVRYGWEWRSNGETKIDNAATNKVLDDIFALAPHHPAHHFRIHLWDNKEATKALESAANNGPAATGIAHMWHMPGHTYSNLNRYADAAWAQEAGARVDHAYMIRDRVMPYEIHNYAHNDEWLVRDLVFVGRISDAIDLAKNMIELPRHPKYNIESNRGSGAEFGRTRLIDVLSQHEMWDQYLAMCDSVYLSENGDADQELRKLRFQGVASAATGKTEQAKKYLARLEDLKRKELNTPSTGPSSPVVSPSTSPSTSLPTSQPVTQPKASLKPGRKNGSARSGPRQATTLAATGATGPTTQPVTMSPTGPATQSASRPSNKRSDRVIAIERAIANINAQLLASSGDAKAAVEMFVQADVRKEHLSQAYLAAGNKVKAEATALAAVNAGKGQTYPLANQVLILHALGKKTEASQAMEKLRDISEGIDLGVPIYSRLTAIAKEMNLPEDWRKARVLPKDIGTRPALETLGPFRWSPSSAPDFSAFAADNAVVSLTNYRGKPVVVVFYLGYGCLHCAKQLAALAPMNKEFNAAGISILAISTDAPDKLHKAWEVAKIEGSIFPFPLASDSALTVFKQYHCYDDFEKAPLHGTFLLDGQGKIRWRDIGPDPFMDISFLLKESKRLLAQPQQVVQGQ